MRILVLLLLSLMLSGCPKVETSPSIPTEHQLPTPYPTNQPQADRGSVLKPISTHISLTPKQKKYLDESLPPDVRVILEKAEKFEILAEVNKDESSETDSRIFNPNRIVVLRSERQKKEVLEAFYSDATLEDSPAICYEPHHSLRATYAGKTVEIEICFDCSRFVVKDSPSKAWGTIVRENRKSERFLVDLVESQGMEFIR